MGSRENREPPPVRRLTSKALWPPVELAETQDQQDQDAQVICQTRLSETLVLSAMVNID